MLIFLKLGGSLITDKYTRSTPRLETIDRLADEIFQANSNQTDLRLVLGHGSGSFGHFPARQYATREGVHTREEWLGFLEVWKEAHALNQIITGHFQQAGIPVLPLQPSASIMASDNHLERWNTEPILRGLEAGLIPLVYGDVIFDTIRGGTILSTEDLFEYLAMVMKPDLILIAGMETGVWKDHQHRDEFISEITPSSYPELKHIFKGSAAVDVTGGMAQKVASMVELVKKQPNLIVRIFSGEESGNIMDALRGKPLGTIIRA
jgi:isopentenyl phosphate kinase